MKITKFVLTLWTLTLISPVLLKKQDLKEEVNYCTSGKCTDCELIKNEGVNSCKVCQESTRVKSQNKEHMNSYYCEGSKTKIDKCLYDDGSKKCSGCLEGYALVIQEDNTTCKVNNFENCLLQGKVQQKCRQCKSGYVTKIDAKACEEVQKQSKIDNCINYSRDSDNKIFCVLCKDGYFEEKDNNDKFIKCSKQDERTKCQNGLFGKDSKYCKKCAIGRKYFAVGAVGATQNNESFLQICEKEGETPETSDKSMLKAFIIILSISVVLFIGFMVLCSKPDISQDDFNEEIKGEYSSGYKSMNQEESTY